MMGRDVFTFVVDAAICFVAVACVALIQFGILEAPFTLLFQGEVEECFGLVV